MATDDDNFLDGPVPPPDTEPGANERAHAKTFGELVDKTLAGRTPAAMTADDRALLEVATVIRAATGKAQLAAATQRSIVEDALRRAVGGSAPATAGSVVPIATARARRGLVGRVGPSRIIAVASTLVAAAALVLWLRTPRTSRPVASVTTAVAPLPETWRSRPADDLIGPIARERAGDAGTRIDTIFADRLDGYRELRLRGSKP